MIFRMNAVRLRYVWLQRLFMLLCGVGGLCLLPVYDISVEAAPIKVVTTNTMVADLAEKVFGTRATVTSLQRPGADPHTYQPTPADVRTLASADLFLPHGYGLDAWADKLIRTAGSKVRTAVVTQGIKTRAGDPHIWLDPLLVKQYVQNISDAAISMDAQGAAYYQSNAQQLERDLDQLDAWIRAQVSSIAPERRKLVTNHNAFAYFAARYGFQVIGSVIPSFSSEAEPSARQLAQLVDTMKREGVRTVFSETTVSPKLAEAVAAQLGPTARVVRLYTESLSAKGGEADTYIKMMRYNVQAIVEGLV